jgi:hypothetical protein
LREHRASAVYRDDEVGDPEASGGLLEPLLRRRVGHRDIRADDSSATFSLRFGRQSIMSVTIERSTAVAMTHFRKFSKRLPL